VAGPGAATQSGAGLFAPSRTSAARVAELARQATTALSTPSFSAAHARARLAPPTSDISATLLSVLSRLPATPPAAPVPPAGAPRAASPGGASTFATNLRPTDFFLEEQPGNGFLTVLVGKTLAEALANQVRYYGRTAPTVAGTILSCSQVAGRMTVGWWALVVGYHDPLRPTGEPRRRISTWGMSCAAATVEQAIAGAYDAAQNKAKEKAKGPFTNYWLYAGVTAELDYARLAAEKRLSNVVPLAAWVMTCETPDTLDWARASFFPQDPGNGAAFSKYLLSPALRQRQYSYVQGRVPVTGYFGCTGFGHTPEPNQPPPVFGTR
jgi:hypothetical protein